jgi:hypothetical protein
MVKASTMVDQQPLDSFHQNVPATNGPPLLRAAWHALRGEWDEAHTIAQDDLTTQGAWVHAWLHRIEGDLGNAGYWYRQAGRAAFVGSPEQEGREIAAALLKAEAGRCSRGDRSGVEGCYS